MARGYVVFDWLKKLFPIARDWPTWLLWTDSSLWVTKHKTIFKTIIQQDVKFIHFIQLSWIENQFLISYPGKEQHNFLILNSAKEANYDKVTSLSSTLELRRYHLP